jgi:hypothetical protein
MCPICVLTAAMIVSGSTCVGGLSIFLIRKTRSQGYVKVAGTGIETLDPQEPYHPIDVAEGTSDRQESAQVRKREQ